MREMWQRARARATSINCIQLVKLFEFTSVSCFASPMRPDGRLNSLIAFGILQNDKYYLHAKAER